MQYTKMSNANNPGSARVSRAGFGVSPKQSFLFLMCKGKARDGEMPSPTRETRALPGVGLDASRTAIAGTVREQRPAFCANADTVAVVNAYRSGF